MATKKYDEYLALAQAKGQDITGEEYDEKDLDEDNKVQGKMPQYIYIKSEDKVYPVTMLQYTFYNSNVQEIPEIPLTVTSIGNGAFPYCTGLASVTIDSATIASSITSADSSGELVNNATTIYIHEDIEETSIGSYIKEKYTKANSSDKEKYDRYTINPIEN